MYTQAARNANRKYRLRRAREAMEIGLCRTCWKLPFKEGSTSCESCLKIRRDNWHKTKNPKRDQQKTIALRIEVFAAYGSKCVCCGDTRETFLEIDHIENNGAKHRFQLGWKGIGANFYKWLKKNEYPSGIQLLCANCHRAKTRNIIPCPH